MGSKSNILEVLKKSLLFLCIITISFFSIDFLYAVNCNYDGSGSVSDALEECVADPNSKLVKNNGNLKVDDGFKTALIDWTTKIATYLAFGAIFSIAFGSLKMVLSGGEEEAIKKGKDVIKWGIIGLLGVISAGFIISVVVKIVYTIGG